jgi:hypothetical protein
LVWTDRLSSDRLKWQPGTDKSRQIAEPSFPFRACEGLYSQWLLRILKHRACRPARDFQWLGAERLEELLEGTIRTALAMQAVRPQELQQINVDTTVQEKAIAFPTDARLYHKMRAALSGTPTQARSSLRRYGLKRMGA